MIEPGRSMSCWAAEITAIASDSAAPGATLKLIVAAGNCSWCVIVSGAVVRSSCVKALNGTCATGTSGGAVVKVVAVVSCVLVVAAADPPGEAGTYSLLSQLGSV